MTGLDKIIKQIETDAEAQAAQCIEAAKAEAEEIVAQAELEGKRQAEAILASGAEECQSLLDRAASADSLESRKSLLRLKQRLIQETIKEARNRLLTLPPAEYFENLKQWIVRRALSKEGVVYFNAKDLQRIPETFEAEVNGALAEKGGRIAVAEEPRPLDGGFVLSYGGVEENCSLDVLFESVQDRLLDRVNAILFSAD